MIIQRLNTVKAKRDDFLFGLDKLVFMVNESAVLVENIGPIDLYVASEPVECSLVRIHI